ncbi:MAG: hypothetical protein RIK87_07625 [Fuerstiella sp.]
MVQYFANSFLFLLLLIGSIELPGMIAHCSWDDEVPPSALAEDGAEDAEGKELQKLRLAALPAQACAVTDHGGFVILAETASARRPDCVSESSDTIRGPPAG